MSRRPARLLHASDCHLGAGGARHERAFAALVDHAVAEGVDALVVAGDLFDHARVPERVLAWARDQLNRLHCPAVLLPGNHDLWGADSVWSRFDVERRCPGVAVLTGEIVRRGPFAFWGEPVVDHAPSFRPLARIPPVPGDCWAVAVAHGLVLERDGPTERGSPIWPSDLDDIGWHYVALGHVANYREVRNDPPTRYSGDVASSRDGEPGAVMVEFAATGVRASWTKLPVAEP